MTEQNATRSVSSDSGFDLTKELDLSVDKTAVRPFGLHLNQFKILTRQQIDQIYHRFNVIRELQKGPHSIVYLVENVYTRQQFAIKKVKKDTTTKEKDGSPRVHLEAHIHLTLNHPRIVKIYDYCETENRQYFLMEYLSRKDLREYLTKIGLPSDYQKSKWFSQTVEALKYCYDHGIMHRDVKSENLMLDQNENIKLIDFGFATRNLISQTICGTLECVAPEILLGQSYDYKVDIWSLGILLFELFFKQTPFKHDSFHRDQIIRSITDYQFIFPARINHPQVEKLIRHLLNKKPELRPTYTDLLNHQFCKYQPK